MLRITLLIEKSGRLDRGVHFFISTRRLNGRSARAVESPFLFLSNSPKTVILENIPANFIHQYHVSVPFCKHHLNSTVTAEKLA
jgi:hypothetical protein